MYTLKNNSIILSEPTKAFAIDLARALEFDFVITSGTRTPAQQVAVMFEKLRLGDDLSKIYADKNFAREITAAYPDSAKALEIVERYAKTNKASAHLRGLALDIRITDLTPAQQSTVIDTAKSMGAYTLYETTPPHIHITIPDNYSAGSINVSVAAPSAKKNYKFLWYAFMAYRIYKMVKK